MNLNRLALQMRPIRVPTMESIRNPTEAFAESDRTWFSIVEREHTCRPL